jgi:hypothetical protein
MGNGSSKKLRQEAMCVVNNQGRTLSKMLTSSVPMIVNKMMMDIVVTIGPIELSEKHDRQMESEETVSKAKNATEKPPT